MIAGAGVATVVLDQLTKSWALRRLRDGEIDVVGSLRFKLVLNPGGAFSIGTGSTGVFVVFGIVMLGGLLWWSRHAGSRLAALGLGLVMGGATGNLIDRLVRGLGGRVVDFIDLQWWPVFNVADAALFCGAIVLLVAAWRQPETA